MKTKTMSCKESDLRCENCNSKNLKHKDLGGYAYAVIETKCLDCKHKRRWVNLEH